MAVVINALNEMRNDLLEEERPTDIVDEVSFESNRRAYKKGETTAMKARE